MKDIGNKILGIILIIIGGVFAFFLASVDMFIAWVFAIIIIIFLCIPGIIMFLDPIKVREKALNMRTSNIHEMTSEGYVHTKDKTTHVSTYQDAVHSNHEYITRIQTPIGFYDVYGKDSYMSYKEGDKVKILVRTRYNKKDKPFMQEVIILGLLAPDIK